MTTKRPLGELYVALLRKIFKIANFMETGSMPTSRKDLLRLTAVCYAVTPNFYKQTQDICVTG